MSAFQLSHETYGARLSLIFLRKSLPWKSRNSICFNSRTHLTCLKKLLCQKPLNFLIRHLGLQQQPSFRLKGNDSIKISTESGENKSPPTQHIIVHEDETIMHGDNALFDKKNQIKKKNLAAVVTDWAHAWNHLRKKTNPQEYNDYDRR